MNDSSPLAAMHPPSMRGWGQPDLFSSRPYSHRPTGNTCGQGPLSVCEQLQRSRPDYFSLKAVRGSSPTASLAADLSQNFRIDSEASPTFPTPRRALFTSNIMERLDTHGHVTTPPLPSSSSPADMSDAMDISPLPHKGAIATTIEVTSPTPVASPDEDMMVESPVEISRPPSVSQEMPKPAAFDRKRMALQRPSLSRAKGYSTSAVSCRLHPEAQLADFRFGSDTSAPNMSTSSLPISECFQDSPPQERRPQTANSPSAGGPGTFRPRPQFSSLTGTRESRNNSPNLGHARRSSNPFARPRRPYRRSLSMFETPGDTMTSKTEDVASQTALQSVMDVEEAQEPVLPHFIPEDQNDNIPRISRATFLDLLDGKFNERYDQKVVVDCRFEYEYEGGHIDGAVNYNDKELLARHLFETPMEGRTLLVFHCEYSAHRAPSMARHVRSEDRTANAELYPRLTYPDVYILDGGYNEFFNQHRNRCYPQAYVEMDAEEHAYTCERELGKLQRRRKGLSRAKTFAFGPREPMVAASPTAPAPSRPALRHSPATMIGNSPILGNDRGMTRRMISY